MGAYFSEKHLKERCVWTEVFSAPKTLTDNYDMLQMLVNLYGCLNDLEVAGPGNDLIWMWCSRWSLRKFSEAYIALFALPRISWNDYRIYNNISKMINYNIFTRRQFNLPKHGRLDCNWSFKHVFYHTKQLNLGHKSLRFPSMMGICITYAN